MIELKKKSAIIALSGGQDSATCLSWANEIFTEIHTVSFNYGQRHQIELECSKELSKLANAKSHTVIDISHLFSQITNSALMNKDDNISSNHEKDSSLPASFVPFRNMLFLTSTTSIAYQKNIQNIITGICQTDFCIPEDELIMTDFGKKYIKDINIGDNVLSFNINNHELEFKKVLNKFDNGERNDILEIICEAGKKLKVTSNHKIYKVNRKNKTYKGWEKEIELVNANTLKPDDFVLIPVPNNKLINKHVDDNNVDLLPFCDLNNKLLNYNSEHIWFKKNNKVNRYVKKIDLIKLVAWYIAEGNLGSGNTKNANTYRAVISQSKSYNTKYYNEIKELVEKFGFKPTLTDNDIYFSGPTTRIFQLCGRISPDRVIPDIILNEDHNLLFETLIKADGSEYQTNSNTTYQYTTKSHKLKEQICWLGIILGYSTTTHYHKDRDIFNISMTKNHKKNMNRIGDMKLCKIKNINLLNESVNVYDITVEDNHNFIAGESSGILVSNSGYPDCRDTFKLSLNTTLNLASDSSFVIHAPLMWKTKAETVKMMYDMGNFHWYENTHTCYNGKRPACGKCPACILRIKGFKEADFIDPLEYEE